MKHPCHLGIDIETYSQLIGANKTVEEIREYIGADSLTYMSVEGLKEACKGAVYGFCTGCFDGKYPYPLESYQADKHKFE